MPRRALAAAIRWSGLAWLVRQALGRRVAILLYHDPDPASLSRQLGWLRRRYRPIELDRLVDALHSGDWSSIPRRGLVVTIDDGHRGNLALAEVFREHGVRPTLFLATGIVASGRHFWFEDVDAKTAERLKGLGNDERLKALAELGIDPDREHDGAEPQALSRADVETMTATCQLGSHTRTHPILPKCPDGLAREEIAASKLEVEQLSGAPCRHFAYPNGAYSERELALVREAGYASARTVDIGWNGRRTDPLRLRILSVADGASNTVLAAELAGLKRLSRLWRREGRLDGSFSPDWLSA
ncbi:MAG: hypothetical protein QOG09_661 [Solirubrobacterales bacterium]|nr:hypothetical protein [Solirubrobacterales bacterium]